MKPPFERGEAHLTEFRLLASVVSNNESNWGFGSRPERRNAVCLFIPDRIDARVDGLASAGWLRALEDLVPRVVREWVWSRSKARWRVWSRTMGRGKRLRLVPIRRRVLLSPYPTLKLAAKLIERLVQAKHEPFPGRGGGRTWTSGVRRLADIVCFIASRRIVAQLTREALAKPGARTRQRGERRGGLGLSRFGIQLAFGRRDRHGQERGDQRQR